MRKYSKFRGGFINTPAKVFTYNKGFTALARSGMNSTPKSGVRRKFLQTAAVKLAGKFGRKVADNMPGISGALTSLIIRNMAPQPSISPRVVMLKTTGSSVSKSAFTLGYPKLNKRYATGLQFIDEQSYANRVVSGPVVAVNTVGGGTIGLKSITVCMQPQYRLCLSKIQSSGTQTGRAGSASGFTKFLFQSASVDITIANVGTTHFTMNIYELTTKYDMPIGDTDTASKAICYGLKALTLDKGSVAQNAISSTGDYMPFGSRIWDSPAFTDEYAVQGRTLVDMPVGAIHKRISTYNFNHVIKESRLRDSLNLKSMAGLGRQLLIVVEGQPSFDSFAPSNIGISNCQYEMVVNGRYKYRSISLQDTILTNDLTVYNTSVSNTATGRTTVVTDAGDMSSYSPTN